ncbi:hypothetical protein [Pseudophaeobacter sp.]|uniref:hypothetical protein n=1 Tax=Pseudophaeobacter sp. TaxID=1971739 RepID=UPI004057F8A0
MTAFEKPARKFRNCSIDGVELPFDDSFGLIAVTRHLVRSALPSWTASNVGYAQIAEFAQAQENH